MSIHMSCSYGTIILMKKHQNYAKNYSYTKSCYTDRYNKKLHKMYLYYCLNAPIDTVSFKKHIYMKMLTAMNYILLLEINTKYRIKNASNHIS